MMMAWQLSERITNKGFQDSIPANAGVYLLVSLMPDGKPKVVERATNKDRSGILYIGTGRNMRGRLTDLQQSFLPAYKGEAHNAGRRYNQIEKLRKRYPLRSLHIRYLVVNTHTRTEARILREYEQQYGELPPLNRVN